MSTDVAEEEGRQVAKALLERPVDERAAWWRGLQDVLGGPETYRGLPPAPERWAWASDATHILTGSEGLAHLIPGRDMHPSAVPSYDGQTVAICGHGASAWITVGRWESDRREACPSCAGQRTTA